MNLIPIFLDFSHIYEQQVQLDGIAHVMIDCSDIPGTNGYCDEAAAIEIRQRLERHISAQKKESCGNLDENSARLLFTDNGNYHYVSNIRAGMIDAPFDMIVFDHHTDMQPPRFGGLMSCGSWIRDTLLENKMLGQVVIIGSPDVDRADDRADDNTEDNAEDNAAGIEADIVEKYSDRVVFLSENEPDIADKITRRLVSSAKLQGDRKVFISIDKDVLSKDECPTNWDQGDMSFENMKIILGDIINSGREICRIDVCGEPEPEASSSDIAKSGDINMQIVCFLQKCLK